MTIQPGPNRALILARLEEIESDERIRDYPAANFFSNSILAAEQMQLKAKADTLRWVLDLPSLTYPIGKQEVTTTDCQACMNDAVLGYKSPLPFCALCGAPRKEAKA